MFSSFDNIFRFTSFGGSHEEGIGGVVSGFPPGITIDEEFVQQGLNRRRPGQSTLTTLCKEADKIEFLPGIFEGGSTGCPIGFIAWNEDQHPNDYNNLKNVYRPSHANYTYTVKCGIRNHRDGGHSSARETISRVVADVLAKSAFRQLEVNIIVYTLQVGPAKPEGIYPDYNFDPIEANNMCCPDPEKTKKMVDLIYKVKDEGDTIGGTLTRAIKGCSIGLGQPVLSRLHATLGNAMSSINAAKAFEYGEGFRGLKMKGSEQNDVSYNGNGRIETHTNHSGGTQGELNNGQGICFRVVFRPIATLLMEQETVNADDIDTTLKARGRHDACVSPRAVPIVEATAIMAIFDYYLLDKATQP